MDVDEELLIDTQVRMGSSVLKGTVLFCITFMEKL